MGSERPNVTVVTGAQSGSLAPSLVMVNVSLGVPCTKNSTRELTQFFSKVQTPAYRYEVLDNGSHNMSLEAGWQFHVFGEHRTNITDEAVCGAYLTDATGRIRLAFRRVFAHEVVEGEAKEDKQSAPPAAVCLVVPIGSPMYHDPIAADGLSRMATEELKEGYVNPRLTERLREYDSAVHYAESDWDAAVTEFVAAQTAMWSKEDIVRELAGVMQKSKAELLQVLRGR